MKKEYLIPALMVVDMPKQALLADISGEDIENSTKSLDGDFDMEPNE